MSNRRGALFKLSRLFLLRMTLIISSALVLMYGLFSAWRVERNYEELRRESTAMEMFDEAIRENLSLLKDVETGARGFIISGQPEFLEPLRRAETEIPDQMRRIRAAVDELGADGQAVDLLLTLTDQRMEHAKGLARDFSGNPVAAKERVSVGKDVMDSVREQSASMLDWTGSRRRAYEETKQKALDKLNSTIMMMAIAALVLNLAIFFSFQSELRARVQAERQAQADHDSLQLALDGAKLGTWHWDLKTNTVIWADRAKAIFGVPADAASLQFDDIVRNIHPDYRDHVIDSVKASSVKEEKWESEYLYAWPDGSLHWIAAAGQSYLDKDGNATRMEGIVQDIDARKKAEQEREHQLAVNLELNSELKSLNKELEMFSYSVSHDLRAPLRHMGGYADMLLKGAGDKLDEKDKRYLNIIGNAVNQMKRLIDELLDFSRVGRTEIREQNLDANSMVRDIITMHLKETEGRKVEFMVGELPPIHGDLTLMRLVFQNLIGNAVKYTGKTESAVIEIGSRQENGKGNVFWVKDNGAGFDMKYADKLFGVFQRLHTVSEFEGNGIGLANVRRIVRRHGGDAWGEGDVGKGATFYFSIPKSES